MTPDLVHVNAALLGVPGGRAALDTPALLLDRPALDRNIAAMAAHAAAVGVALRPHAKTHKSARIAALQVAAGARGIACATLGEAEVMVAAGIPNVLVTSPQVTVSKIARLAFLAARAPGGLAVVADDFGNIEALNEAAEIADATLEVLVDCAAGHHRTGVTDAAAATGLAGAIATAPHLRFGGLQHYSGNVQHLPTREGRRREALSRLDWLAGTIDALRRAGLEPPIVTGAGTGTFDIDHEAQLFTELQVGSYVFMDADYLRALTDGRKSTAPFEVALYVETAIVSTASFCAKGWVTTDAGIKAFATDGGLPEIASGAPSGSRYEFFGDEHGQLILPPGTEAPRIGHRLACVTPHCDPTVNLWDVYHVVDGDTLIDIWPVDARGRR